MTKIQGIYKITNNVDGKFYIGSSVNLKNRLANHFSKLRNNKHSNIYLQRAFIVHGEANFKAEIVEVTNNLHQSELLDIEQKYLDDIEDWSTSYNLTKNTKAFGTIYADETEKRARKSARVIGENNPFYGKTHSQENKMLMTESRRKRGGSAYRKSVGARWETSIKVNKKSIYLGSYETEKEACYVRVLAEKFYWDKDGSVKEELDKAQLSSPKKSRKLPSGVYKKGKYDKYEARLVVNKQKIYIGTFDTPELAYTARQEALQSLLS
jgi:group I intron endonuclease